mmetsp:Transcript_77257/g.145645  ORF Transcript_77257/g.145645 Transcript_77257/m.145645 type:complete len:232 (-) Transcript_77257:16-711(-)
MHPCYANRVPFAYVNDLWIAIPRRMPELKDMPNATNCDSLCQLAQSLQAFIGAGQGWRQLPQESCQYPLLRKRSVTLPKPRPPDIGRLQFHLMRSVARHFDDSREFQHTQLPGLSGVLLYFESTTLLTIMPCVIQFYTLEAFGILGCLQAHEATSTNRHPSQAHRLGIGSFWNCQVCARTTVSGLVSARWRSSRNSFFSSGFVHVPATVSSGAPATACEVPAYIVILGVAE